MVIFHFFFYRCHVHRRFTPASREQRGVVLEADEITGEQGPATTGAHAPPARTITGSRHTATYNFAEGSLANSCGKCISGKRGGRFFSSPYYSHQFKSLHHSLDGLNWTRKSHPISQSSARELQNSRKISTPHGRNRTQLSPPFARRLRQ